LIPPSINYRGAHRHQHCFPTRRSSDLPVKVAVLPLQKNKEELLTTARSIHNKLKRLMVSQYDDVANIGRRYRRQDEIGTPYCVTDRKSTRLNSSHVSISYAVFCLKKKK